MTKIVCKNRKHKKIAFNFIRENESNVTTAGTDTGVTTRIGLSRIMGCVQILIIITVIIFSKKSFHRNVNLYVPKKLG